MRVGFTGSQKGSTPAQLEAFAELLRTFPAGSILHHGDCIGWDKIAHGVARQLKWSVILHPPTNPSKRAFCEGDYSMPEKDYLPRDRDLVDLTEVLVACPSNFKNQVRSGTWYTVRYALKLGRKVYCVFPDGRVVVQ